MIYLGGILVGLVALVGGGVVLIRGASQGATRMGVSPMIVGLTVVGFGTSSPELAVNVIGAFENQTELAFGNVIGSNIANLGLILGLAALMNPIAIQSQLVRRELPLLLLVTTIAMVMALDGFLDGELAKIERSESIVLLFLFGMFIYIATMDVIRSRQRDTLLAGIVDSPMVRAAADGRLWWLSVLIGLVLMVGGAEMTVRSSVLFASHLGVSTAIIGLFVVAVGTSLPELAASVIAAIRKEPDLALGNVIGSNIFNLLFVLPSSGLIRVVTVPPGGVADIVVSWLFAAALIPIFLFRHGTIGRKSGAVFLLAYCTYAVARNALSVQ